MPTGGVEGGILCRHAQLVMSGCQQCAVQTSLVNKNKSSIHKFCGPICHFDLGLYGLLSVTCAVGSDYFFIIKFEVYTSFLSAPNAGSIRQHHSISLYGISGWL